MEVKSFDQIYTDMRNYIIAHQDRLTDFNDGSTLSSQVEATAREAAMLYVRCRVGFSTYLRALPYSVFGFNKKEGLKASVKITFSRSKPFSYSTSIPAGTKVSAGSMNFYTTELGSIESGEINSGEIMTIAEAVGEKYNVSARTIKKIISTLPADVISVNNTSAASGGIDSEDWRSYIDRFASYILGLSRTNEYGFLSGLTETHLVRSLTTQEHFPPLNGIWNMTVYIEDGSGGMTPDAMAEVKAKIDGDGTPENGGYRAPGVNIRYVTPENIPVGLNITVYTKEEVSNEVDESVVIDEIEKEVRKYINSMKIGQSLLLTDIVVLLKRISYIDDCQVLSPEGNITDGNIEISNSQIARFDYCVVRVVVK